MFKWLKDEQKLFARPEEAATSYTTTQRDTVLSQGYAKLVEHGGPLSYPMQIRAKAYPTWLYKFNALSSPIMYVIDNIGQTKYEVKGHSLQNYPVFKAKTSLQ